MGNSIPLSQETNTSGQGKNALIPKEVKRFNWGGFFFTWIWGLANRSYLTLISLALGIISFILPFIIGMGAGISGNQDFFALGIGFGFIFGLITTIAGIALRIWFGVKGNDWAWQNMRWQSVEHFNDVQRIWAIVGTVFVAFFVFVYIGIIAAMTLPALLGNTSAARNNAMMKKSMVTVMQATVINEALEQKCNMTSEGLAKCFSKRINGTLSGNKIMGNGSIADFIFYGNGKCNSKNTCYVTIDTTNAGGNDSYTLHLYSDKGYVKINQEDQDDFMEKYSTK